LFMSTLKELSLEDEPLFTQIFSKLQPESSEFTFAYLYMWKRDYNLRYAIVDGYLCLVSRSRVSIPFVFCPIPINGVYETKGFGNALEFLAQYAKDMGDELVFGRVEENKVTYLRDYFKDQVEVEHLPGDSDYVYETASLISLAGRKLSGKRNHISQFKRAYPDHEYVPVTLENIADCRSVLDEWCDRNETECVHPDNCERLACYEILNNWSRLPLKGALVRVNGRFEAFTIGEKLNESTAVIRVEKGNSDIHGIYTFINQEFCRNEWSQTTLVNREEDMGKEGLRNAKLSYYPYKMINKYLIRVKR